MSQNWRRTLDKLDLWWDETLPLLIEQWLDGKNNQALSYELVKSQLSGYPPPLPVVEYKRYSYQPSLQTKRRIQNHIRMQNFFRWRCLHSDIRWLKKRLERVGVNPEDWRWFLDE